MIAQSTFYAALAVYPGIWGLYGSRRLERKYPAVQGACWTAVCVKTENKGSYMSQKKKVRFKILAAPDDLSEIKNKVKKFRIRKIRRLLVPAVLILLAVCGTYLLLKNQTYTQARTTREYPADISDTSSYTRFEDGIVRYNRDGVAFLNKKNEEQWIQPAQIQNPIIVAKEKAFAVADNGGNNIMVFTEEGLKGEIETTLPIE